MVKAKEVLDLEIQRHGIATRGPLKRAFD